MKTRCLAIGLTVLLCLAAGPAVAQQLPPASVPAGETVKPAPHMIFDQTEHDAGEIDPATVISNTFTFKNEGDAPLIIERVLSGCGCAVIEADREVAPGETGRVTISVRVYREWAGQSIRKASWIFTNDPLSPQIRLIMTAQVRETPAVTAPSGS